MEENWRFKVQWKIKTIRYSCEMMPGAWLRETANIIMKDYIANLIPEGWNIWD